ncbi:NBAS subunit of NRZ tethering complex-like [Saccoglossus kowalevskii]
MIKKSLLSSHSTYKNAPKLLQLAMLLRVSGDDIDDRNGRVLVLIAMAALQAHDYRVAHDTCSDLMSQYYHPAWRVCKQLGECEEFKDLTARRCLLSYAVTYCDDDVIESLMNSRSLLETQVFINL